jgi:hypothetical protein
MSGEMSGGSVGFRACVASCKNSMRRTTKSAVFWFGVHGDRRGRSAQTTQSVANKHIASKQRNRVGVDTLLCVLLLSMF